MVVAIQHVAAWAVCRNLCYPGSGLHPASRAARTKRTVDWSDEFHYVDRHSAVGSVSGSRKRRYENVRRRSRSISPAVPCVLRFGTVHVARRGHLSIAFRWRRWSNRPLTNLYVRKYQRNAVS